MPDLPDDFISNIMVPKPEESVESLKDEIKFLKRVNYALANKNDQLRKALKSAEEYKNMYLDKVFGGDSNA